MKRSRSGQSTLEYVIIFAAIIGVVVWVAGRLQPKIWSSFMHLNAQMRAHVYTAQ